MSVWNVTRAVARRSLLRFFKNPSVLLPSILFPLVFFTAFAAGLSSVGNVPGFGFRSGYTAFQFVFVLLQSAAFGGVFTGFAVASDFDSGFARRLFLAAPSRVGIVLGWVLSAMVRALMIGALLFVVALIFGMQVDGSGVDLVGLIGLALLINVAAALWALGIALRFRTIQAAPLMQTPIFLVLFLAPVYVPINLLQGWIHTVAGLNPASALLGAGRGFISGVPDDPGLAFACGAGLVLVFALWARRGLHAAERAG